MKLDFRTKLALTVVISYILLLGNLHHRYFPLVVCLAALPYLFLLLAGKIAEAVKGLLLIGLAVVMQYILLRYHLSSSILQAVFLFMTMVVLRMSPGVMMGRYSLLTTSMSDLVASLQRMKLPDSLIIPISVMFRFFYTVKEDYRQIRDAMYLHGLTCREFFKNPARMLEYRYVPLLVCLTRTADDVAISAMTRGLVVGGRRSSLSQTRLGLLDYLLLGLLLAVLALDIWSRYA
ncbi:Transmembrane component of energizing module of putative ECF transporter [Streptococcus sp. DD11]|uniref:energy-coupling factor transporter transmembrane component T n=1 Tax=Streptococcus sp. DD11 TaxID=1777879 RepID=UPI000791AC2E|nr:energy-coupling factor transporter transmembrane component T [Streptococcus sp. DD11]KXT85849.1 Transmembrane component of energizing module of putative ECF transporter [Streptococcus sp. DD11]